MIAAPTDAAFDWIRNGRREMDIPADRSQFQCRVRNLMPDFERYAKILHFLEAHYEHIDNPLSPREAEIVGLPECHAIKSFVEMKRNRSSSTRFRWQEIADWLNVPYKSEICHEWFVKRLRPNPQCWPSFIWGPSDGYLDPVERRDLISTLKRFTRNEECFFRFAEMPFIATDTPLLFSGQLDELETLLVKGGYQFSPEYWWPADHSWCVCSDYDLTFTVVGGASSLIEALLQSERLEVLEVAGHTRVDSLVPMPSDDRG